MPRAATFWSRKAHHGPEPARGRTCAQDELTCQAFCFGGWSQQPPDAWLDTARAAAHLALCLHWLNVVHTEKVARGRLVETAAGMALRRRGNLADTHQLVLELRSFLQNAFAASGQFQNMLDLMRTGDVAREAVFPPYWPIHGIWLVTSAKLAKALYELTLCVALARKARRILGVTHKGCAALRLAQQLEEECAMVLASHSSQRRRR